MAKLSDDSALVCMHRLQRMSSTATGLKTVDYEIFGIVQGWCDAGGGGASIFPFLCFLISFHLLSLAGGRESAENSPAKLTKRQKPSEKGDAREIYLRYKPILAGVADNSLSQNFAHLCKAVNI